MKLLYRSRKLKIYNHYLQFLVTNTDTSKTSTFTLVFQLPKTIVCKLKATTFSADIYLAAIIMPQVSNKNCTL